jgi:hypothetical protein
MTTEPLEPLDDDPDQDIEKRHPDEVRDHEDPTGEVPNEKGKDPDPAIPPPEPTNG